jgi:hypothetical protein
MSQAAAQGYKLTTGTATAGVPMHKQCGLGHERKGDAPCPQQSRGVPVSRPCRHVSVPRCGTTQQFVEFLTHETTCASKMLEKTTYEIFYQKRSPEVTWHHAVITVAGTLARQLQINSCQTFDVAFSTIFILFTCFEHRTTTVL